MQHGAWHAWNACLSHLVALAEAHMERVIFKAFLNKIAAETDVHNRRLLSSMAELYALEILVADHTLRNEEYIAPAKAKAMERQIRALCQELRDVAEACVAAFDIPDAILRAPIGLHHGQDANLFDEYLQQAGFGVHPTKQAAMAAATAHSHHAMPPNGS